MLSRKAFRAAAAACCAVSLLATPALAASGGPGGPGAGDPYFPNYGNGGYDVSHYTVDVKYEPASDHLIGTTELTMTPLQELTEFNLDIGLGVKSVTINHQPAKVVNHSGLELTVTPAQPLPQGEEATVTVEYEGVPSTVNDGGKTAWVRTSDGALAVGQPQIAAWWFPSNDHPSDKATYDISINVPEGVEALSNGVQTAPKRPAEPGRTVWRWQHGHPAATYLAFMAIGQYEIHNGIGFGGQPAVTAYSEKLHPNIKQHAKDSIGAGPEVVGYLASRFGPYPFEAQGGVAASEGLGFALENQTRSTYSHRFFERGPNTSVVVHENAHQWFGDSVSIDNWRNIWLNEGFATYSEWLWSESKGTGTAQELFNHYYNSLPADDPFWQVKPGDPGKENVFHDAVYDRGAMTLHAARNVIGNDVVFFDILRTWADRNQYGNAHIEEFLALAEQKSGKQLDAVFASWLFTAGKPPARPELGVKPMPRTLAKTAKPRAVDELNETHAHVHGH